MADELNRIAARMREVLADSIPQEERDRIAELVREAVAKLPRDYWHDFYLGIRTKGK